MTSMVKVEPDFPFGMSEPFSAEVDTWRSVWFALAEVNGQDGRTAMVAQYRWMLKHVYLPRARRAKAARRRRAEPWRR